MANLTPHPSAKTMVPKFRWWLISYAGMRPRFRIVGTEDHLAQAHAAAAARGNGGWYGDGKTQLSDEQVRILSVDWEMVSDVIQLSEKEVGDLSVVVGVHGELLAERMALYAHQQNSGS